MFRVAAFLSCILLLSLSVSGCAGTYKHSVNFSPKEPLRVVVLPFVQVDKKGNIVAPDTDLLIDDVSLISSQLKETPAEYVRGLVLKNLKQTGLDLVDAATVSANLLHSGFGKEDLSYDLERIFATDPRSLCSSVLTCDAVLYGKVTEWDRSYFAIQSTSSVGIELKMVSARDGSVLFSSSGSDSDSRGLTKGPTGFSDLVLEPLKGLDNKILTDLARAVVVKMLSPLVVTNRPEFLNSSPPAIFASAHDRPDGTLVRDSSLKVLAFGSPDQRASFSIGDYVQRVPMVQKDRGHYIGEYFPLPTDSFENQFVSVFLIDEFGRTTQQKVGAAPVSLAQAGK